jgi:inhibitor of KinA
MVREHSVHPYGEAALIVETTEEIAEDTFRFIRGLASLLESFPPAALRELIPAYNSLLVVYDPAKAGYEAMEAWVLGFLDKVDSFPLEPQQGVRLPVCYEEPHAPDLGDVARHAGITAAEVVAIHSAGTYLVYMLGFTPGFPYLGGMSERIATPRRKSPRTRIPAGSVGIAGSQTGVYPLASPGGWNIIGCTPVPLFDHTRQPPALLGPGQYVRFHPIDPGEFDRIAEAVARGEWRPEAETVVEPPR